MFITVLRVLLIISGLLIFSWALRYRLLRRPLLRNFFETGRVSIDPAGIERTHKVAEDTISTADRSVDGRLETKIKVSNDSSLASHYSIVAHLKSGPPEVYERVNLTIENDKGEKKWEGPLAELAHVGDYEHLLARSEEEELRLTLTQEDLTMKGAVDVEFEIYASPMGARTEVDDDEPPA